MRMLIEGDVKAWDITGFGEFTNPEAKTAYESMKEALARINTGAAYTNTEDKRFEQQLGNWKYLTTPAGRKTILDNTVRFIQRNEGSSNAAWGNDGWKVQYGVIGKAPSLKNYTSEEEARKDGNQTGDYGKLGSWWGPLS